MSNLGCIFDHTVNGDDCTTGGGRLCRKHGSDYCSAAMANGTRVCCDATTTTTTTTPTYTGTTDQERCPTSNAGMSLFIRLNIICNRLQDVSSMIRFMDSTVQRAAITYALVSMPTIVRHTSERRSDECAVRLVVDERRCVRQSV